MTEYRIEIDPRDVEDIESATEWLLEHAPHKVSEWLGALETTIGTLKTMPHRRSHAPENGRWEADIELRQLLFDAYPSKYRIIFTIIEVDTVRVLQVRHGSRPFMHESEN